MPDYSVPLHVTASAIRRRIMMSAPPGDGYVIKSDSTVDEGYSWVLLSGGGGASNHAALSNLGWTYSGHTHTGTGIAGFNGSGAAAIYGYGTAGGVAAYNTTVANFGALTPVEGKWLGYSSGALTWSTPTAAVDWVTFVGQASNPGGASTTSTLYMSDGTEYDAGTLIWSRRALFRDAVSFGEPGTEDSNILLDGTTYTVPVKVNRFGTARAGFVLHQHSDTVEPDLVFARARGTTSSHTIVQDTDIFGRLIFGGWLNSTIGYARGAEIRAHADGTISTTSMPTRIDFATCGSGATTVTDRWCILPNGTFRPAADNTYQIGNTSYALTEGWARQWMFLEQAAVTAPAGGWAGRSGIWAKNDTPTIPMFTDDTGTDYRLQYWDADLAALAANSTNGLWARTGAGTGAARTLTGTAPITVTNGDGVSGNPTVAVSVGTSSAAGVYELATYGEGQTDTATARVPDVRSDWEIYRPGLPYFGSHWAGPNNTVAIGDYGTCDGSAVTGTWNSGRDSNSGLHYAEVATSTGTQRNILWATNGASMSSWSYGDMRFSFIMRVPGGTANVRYFCGLTLFGGSSVMTSVESTVTAHIRFGWDTTSILAICADGTTRTKTTFSTSTTGSTSVYEFEIVPNRGMTSVVFNLYTWTATGGRGALVETATITTNIPSGGSTTIYPGVWALATSGTPNVQWYGSRFMINLT